MYDEHILPLLERRKEGIALTICIQTYAHGP